MIKEIPQSGGDLELVQKFQLLKSHLVEMKKQVDEVERELAQTEADMIIDDMS